MNVIPFFTSILLIINLCIFGVAVLFTFESYREQEPRAPFFGTAGIIVHLIFFPLLFFSQTAQTIIACYFAILIALGFFLLIPGKHKNKVTLDSNGFVVGSVDRFDERENVFARNGLKPGTEQYKYYYQKHPDQEERDTKRRSMGGNLGKLGSIDNRLPTNVNMVLGSVSTLNSLEPNSLPAIPKNIDQVKLDPQKATHIIKSWAKHIGADLVGVCKVDKRWVYSHRGCISEHQNIGHWGQLIEKDFPYAVVITTEMDHDVMAGAPHTPVVVETMRNYSKGAFITTTLANWFAHMGYQAVANHAAYYEALMVPLSIDAGLGQLGRLGYTISQKFGPRMRLAAVLTDMPLIPDKPIDLGVDEFCKTCKKCAESCPSNSIPIGNKTIHNGLLRWKLNAETCHNYWGKVGTDCGICMAVCPYSRPNRTLHKVVKLILKHSRYARFLLPHIDNIIYGRRWKPRNVPSWLDFRAK
jgi:reductive dehalogenase